VAAKAGGGIDRRVGRGDQQEGEQQR